MMHNIRSAGQWLRKLLKFNKYSTLRTEAEPHQKTTPQSDRLVKNRPLSMEDRYRIVEDTRVAESVFKRLAAPLMELCDDVSNEARKSQQGRVVLRELGTTSDRRSYLFMKSLNDYGWLMERGGVGWRISRAEKIIGQDMFMRSSNDPWDVATVWSDPKGEGMQRIRSQRFGGELMSVTEYERRLIDAMREQLAQLTM
jgi:hypothetical protein